MESLEYVQKVFFAGYQYVSHNFRGILIEQEQHSRYGYMRMEAERKYTINQNVQIVEKIFQAGSYKVIFRE